MRHKRQKEVRKFLTFHKTNFHLALPYNVIVDAEFMNSALMGGFEVREHIPKLLQQKWVRLCTTKCILDDCKKKGKRFQATYEELLNFAVHPCRHQGNVKEQHICIQKLIHTNNKDGWIVAGMSRTVKKEARRIPGVPVLSIHKTVMFMEQPSEASKKFLQQRAQTQGGLTKAEKAAVARALKSDPSLAFVHTEKKRKITPAPSSAAEAVAVPTTTTATTTAS